MGLMELLIIGGAVLFVGALLALVGMAVFSGDKRNNRK